MTDREMLELAARAAGYKFKMPEDKSTKAGAILGTDWNPLKNKADAFDRAGNRRRHGVRLTCVLDGMVNEGTGL